MKQLHATRAIASLLFATLVAGCGVGGGRTWVPQGPGNEDARRDEAETRAEIKRETQRAQQRAAAAPAAAPEQKGSLFRGTATPTPAPAAPAPAAAAPRVASTGSEGYTQATRYGDLLFVSGQIALDTRSNQMVGEKVEDQTRYVMERIRSILEENRLTMANVVSVTVYVKDLSQFRAMNEAYESFFRGALPARSVVEVARLPRGALVEISVVAGK